jgi:hypothetical protein
MIVCFATIRLQFPCHNNVSTDFPGPVTINNVNELLENFDNKRKKNCFVLETVPSRNVAKYERLGSSAAEKLSEDSKMLITMMKQNLLW